MATHNPAPRSKPAASPRRRLTAAEARARILSAAERRLSEVGPEGLRLIELAAELGISHPAILHHFGSREELVAAVVTGAISRLNQRLAEALESRKVGSREAILDMIAEFYGAQGNARLIAWLVLSGHAQKAGGRREAPRPLQQLIELSHAQRIAAHPAREIDFEDSVFRSELTALALLGEAIFGDLIRYAAGASLGPERSRDFRRRLAKLLSES